jgi:recombination protein RecT
MTAAIEKPRPMSAAQQRDQELAKSTWGLLQGMKHSIAAILPKHLTPERMAMIAFTAMRQNPKLLLCSKESIIGSIMTASILGLEPSGPLGHGALVPYKGECQFQPMYQGLLELARRSGFIKDVQLRAVYKGDHYRFRFGLDPTIEHTPLEGDGADNPDRECTHVYCIIRFNNGGLQWDQMSMSEALAHAKRFSKTWDTTTQKFTAGTPWAEHPVAMAQKTILKRTLKLCPKSPEMSLAMQLDDLGEAGKMATLKQNEDGIFDVDFGGSEEPAPSSNGAASGVLDKLVQQSKSAAGNKPEGGAHTERGSNTPTPAGISTPAAPAAVCEVRDFEMLEILGTENKVGPKKWKKHIEETMGFSAWELLTKDRYAEVEAYIKANKRD